MNDTSSASGPKQFLSGIVKQVLDGGTVVIRGQPRNGPPPEKTLALAEIDAPRMARRPTATSPKTSDEPLAWESREFLRNLLVGNPVMWCVHHKAGKREYGVVMVGNEENVATKLVAEGLAKTRDGCQDEVMKAAQGAAQAAGKGLWAQDASSKVRDITWEMENPRSLVDKMQGKPVSAVVESVRDGSTVRAFLLPDFYHVTLMMSGVRSPNVKPGPEGKPDPIASEGFAVEAQYFTESRLLQRDVEIVLESVNNKNYVGTILHPNGNIAEGLLKEGFGKCVDWSIGCVTGGPEKYRQAQASAKEKKLRLWKDYEGPTGPTISAKDKEFTGKVVEVINGDAVVVKRGKNDVKKVHLASIRPPRLDGPDGKAEKPIKTGGGAFRPLYDIPYMFDAREFLRKKLIGHNVQVTVDYIQPSNNDFPEKTCCTLTIGGVNVAEALVSRGLATVVRYSADNDQRSSKYDDLLSAEDKAKKTGKGMHNKKAQTPRRIADISGDVAKSKQFLPFLQRAGRMQAVVEFVASASRFRVYIPRETCVITFLLSGISCPKGERIIPRGPTVPAEPFGNEAAAFVKDLVLQKEVEIEVETIDKGGNFIGWCFDGSTNISVSLVEEGFASAYLMGDRTSYGNVIQVAEESAKTKRLRRWANFKEEDEEAKQNAEEKEKLEIDEERKVNYINVVVTEVTPEAKVFVQHVDEGPKLDQLMKQLREEFVSNPPLAGAYQPKKGDLCAAKFVDDQWYRAKVEKLLPNGDVIVFYVDFGNKADIPKTKCGTLPSSFSGLPSFAHDYTLALCLLAPDEDYAAQGLAALRDDLLDKPMKLNVEYKAGGSSYATLVDDKDQDIVRNLIVDGLMMADKKGGRKVAKLVKSYFEAMESAKKNHLNIWEYGDITADDAREFGVGY